MDQMEDVPMVPLASHELQMMDSVITGYLGYLKRQKVSARQDAEKIKRLGMLQKKLKGMLAQGSVGAKEPISFEEVEDFTKAITAFINIVAMLVPASRERNGVIQDLRALREKIAVLRASFN